MYWTKSKIKSSLVFIREKRKENRTSRDVEITYGESLLFCHPFKDVGANWPFLAHNAHHNNTSIEDDMISDELITHTKKKVRSMAVLFKFQGTWRHWVFHVSLILTYRITQNIKKFRFWTRVRHPKANLPLPKKIGKQTELVEWSADYKLYRLLNTNIDPPTTFIHILFMCLVMISKWQTSHAMLEVRIGETCLYFQLYLKIIVKRSIILKR
jgi:hypothetical protein